MHIYNEFKSSFIIVTFLGYIFLVSGLIINFLQLCSCIIWPFSKELYRKINRYLALGIWSLNYTTKTTFFHCPLYHATSCPAYFTPSNDFENLVIIFEHIYRYHATDYDLIRNSYDKWYQEQKNLSSSSSSSSSNLTTDIITLHDVEELCETSSTITAKTTYDVSSLFLR
ncbi:unnamed protein product [Rotaria sordida]|uniref:Uncharacterized protein n=1 Tax=Rotaria sordida TaxID=392033 RepID=A0A814UUY4_9BILA|nr:unnamed protein product [Rotaria sordida]CAF1439668.1 unnamed protein product [Rotaria sordida]